MIQFRLVLNVMSLLLTLKIVVPKALRLLPFGQRVVTYARITSFLSSSSLRNSRAFSYRLWIGKVSYRTMATGNSTKDGSGGSSAGPRQNRLAKEKSPYLLQHATNPVDWYPWGPEALAKAKAENKLIFLSVGYSTCHWCHVMEKESFENEAIALIMNKYFVNIKVDREERPDLDRVYMTYVQAVRGSGGWPMSVWLTPDLKPIFGGTYFPPSDRYFGQPGFPTVLHSIAKQWEEEADKFHITGSRVVVALSRQTTIEAAVDSAVPPGKPLAQACHKVLARIYEPEYGGFGQAPKFPQAVNFTFMFRFYALNPSDPKHTEALNMCLHTLKMMARGGIHDHVAQGFHRYSTDNEWHVPHFEKMLYDQAQLAVAYTEAYQITTDPLFAAVAKDILQYVSRDLNNEVGGFYSAEDADSLPEFGASAKKEGGFCVWEKNEVEKILDIPAEGADNVRLHELICEYFSIKEEGNVDPYKDPHHELVKKNVLIIQHEEQTLADKFGITVETLRKEVHRGCNLLLEKRKQRPKPHLDDKMIAAWNGMMISAFAKAGQVFDDEQYLNRAVKGATFLLTHMTMPTNTENLLRSCYRGPSGAIEQIPNPISGFLDDYVQVIQAFLDLYEATGDSHWLEQAVRLQAKQDSLFWDEDGGAYFMAGQHDPDLVLRLKDDQDGAEPSANSVAVFNLVRLFYLMDDPSQWERAKAVLRTYSERLAKIPVALPLMVSGLLFFHSKLIKIVLAGNHTSKDMKAMKAVVNSIFLPHKVLVEVNQHTDEYLLQNVPFLNRMTPLREVTTAFVCEGMTCSAPVTDPEELRSLLTGQK